METHICLVFPHLRFKFSAWFSVLFFLNYRENLRPSQICDILISQQQQTGLCVFVS